MAANRRGGLVSALQMGAGLAVLGVSGYVFLAVVGHTLPKEQATAVQSVYFLANIIGPGVFAGLEQETNRSTAASLAAKQQLAPVMRRAGKHAAAVLAITVVALLAAAPLLTSRALHGYWVLLLETMLAASFAALIYVVRGLVGGQGRFAGYSVTLAVEGLMRLIPCVLIAVLGGASVWVFGLIFACGQGFATLSGLRWLKSGSSGTGQPTQVVASVGGADAAKATGGGVAMLVVATLLAQLVANLAPLIVSSRLVGDAELAFAFGQAFVLLRVPLLLFSPVQAMLLPGLTVAAAAGHMALVRKRMWTILLAVLAVGALGTAVGVVFGGWMLRVFFAVRVPLSPALLGLLGVGTIFLMSAYILQTPLIALGRHRWVSVSWVAGTALLVVLALLPMQPVHAALLGLVVGPALVVCIMLVTLRSATRGSSASAIAGSTHTAEVR